MLGRTEQANQICRGVYSGNLKLYGEEHEQTLLAAYNYENSLIGIEREKEAKSLLRKTIPIARRVLGESNEITLRMEANYATALINADDATLDDLREAVATLEDTTRVARRVLGGAHPITVDIEANLQLARAALRARETPSPPGQA